MNSAPRTLLEVYIDTFKYFIILSSASVKQNLFINFKFMKIFKWCTAHFLFKSTLIVRSRKKLKMTGVLQHIVTVKHYRNNTANDL